MYRILGAEKDCYITNRIVDDSFRATDANVGRAGTLDLFKLYDESTLSGTAEPVELSRLLVQFDLDPIRALTGSIVDVTDGSFKATLVLHDIAGGQPLPSNFTVMVHPVSRSWDEGVGRDVGRFSDLDSANWVTASSETGVALGWNTPGANATGVLGATDIDVVSSGNLGDGQGIRNLFKTQLFVAGDEDLSVDVTDLVSATLVGQLPDFGYRIAFSGALETNSSTLFVKRFASRHVTNPRLRPSLVVKFDDSLRDNHDSFVFDATGSLFVFNDVRGTPTHLMSGSTPLTGSSALLLKLISGSISPVTSQSYTASFAVDQFSYGVNFVTGVYVSTFALSSLTPALRSEVFSQGSATFHAIWGSNDGTVPFRTGSLVVRRSDLTTFVEQDRMLDVTIPNHRQVYRRASRVRVRVNVFDLSPETGLRFSRLPVERQSLTFDRMYWRVVDVYSGEVVVPFDVDDGSTRLSVDSRGMFFDFFPEDMTLGRVLGFEFMVRDAGEDIVVDRNLPTFRVEP